MTYRRWFCAKIFFRKNFIWRHNDVIKNVYFLMKCSVKSVKHAFLTAILALLYEINMYFLNFYRLENEMKLMLKKNFFEFFWVWPSFFQKTFLIFFFFFTIFFLNLGYIARMFSKTMKDNQNQFFAYCLWHIGDGSARKDIFRNRRIQQKIRGGRHTTLAVLYLIDR